MSHFSPAEFVDAAEGNLSGPRAAHIEQCARCRDQMSMLRSALDATHAPDVPEPSPLYWPHMAARIHERVAAGTIVPAWRARPWREVFTVRGLVPAASALALVAAVFATGLVTRNGVPSVAPVPAPMVAAAPAGPAVAPEDAEVWQVLTSAAAEVPIEEAHDAGMGVPSGALDRAVQRMTPDELNELGRLLQTELHRSGN